MLQLIYTLSFGRYRANPTFCLTLSILRKRGYFVEAVKSVIRLKTVPTNGFIRLPNIYRFVWSVWSEPDILPYAFDTSEAWVFCRGCQIRNPLEDSTDKRFYSLAEYIPFRLVGMERTRHFALRFRYFGSVGILSR